MYSLDHSIPAVLMHFKLFTRSLALWSLFPWSHVAEDDFPLHKPNAAEILKHLTHVASDKFLVLFKDINGPEKSK